jgi:PadR family transcriptional regulator PadR
MHTDPQRIPQDPFGGRRNTNLPDSLSVETLLWIRDLTDKGSQTTLSPNMFMGATQDEGDLIQGTLEMLVLKALARGPLHGYAVAEWIERTSQQVLRVEEGALYPALHRLELRGLLKAKWGASENNRRAKFYDLTAEGHKRLNAESRRWARLSAAVAFVMQAS